VEGEGRKGREGEGRSVPVVPNLPLHHWLSYENAVCHELIKMSRVEIRIRKQFTLHCFIFRVILNVFCMTFGASWIQFSHTSKY